MHKRGECDKVNKNQWEFGEVREWIPGQLPGLENITYKVMMGNISSAIAVRSWAVYAMTGFL